jgi:hypothetical protein
MQRRRVARTLKRRGALTKRSTRELSWTPVTDTDPWTIRSPFLRATFAQSSGAFARALGVSSARTRQRNRRPEGGV